MNLIFDINNAFYKSYFMYKKYGDKKINEKLFFNKFITDFFYTIRLFNEYNKIDRIVCCFDSQNCFRKQIYSNYKSNRIKNGDPGFYNVLDYVYHYLEKEGFIVSKVNGLEADDLCSLWVNILKDETMCVLSNDEDLRQLLSENVFIYNNQSHDKRFYFSSNLLSSIHLHAMIGVNTKYIISDPDFILFKKMLLGCNSDMVPCLVKKGIGEKRLKSKIFDNVFFDKNNILNTTLIRISSLLKSKFDCIVSVSNMHTNLSLVDLSGKYISRDIKMDILNKINDVKFTYSKNYQL